jgi:hypothetical protein
MYSLSKSCYTSLTFISESIAESIKEGNQPVPKTKEDPPKPKEKLRLVTAKQDQKARALDVALQNLATFNHFNNNLTTWLEGKGKVVGGIDDLTGSFRNGLILIIQGEPWAPANQVYEGQKQIYDARGKERLEYLKTQYEMAQFVSVGSVSYVVNFTIAVTKAQNARIDLDHAMAKDE